jgi:hypothetical protein
VLKKLHVGRGHPHGAHPPPSMYGAYSLSPVSRKYSVLLHLWPSSTITSPLRFSTPRYSLRLADPGSLKIFLSAFCSQALATLTLTSVFLPSFLFYLF